MIGKDILIIPRKREGESSDLFKGTWLEYSASLHHKFGSTVYQSKDGVEYLVIQTNLEKNETAETALSIKEYFTYGWDIKDNE